ncbi:hypothetical protein CEXT_499581 [Caerostris extrusa]|uniref:Uncharacterized protein n=1 Tax=Caerostris extrusa TaxID=172846 RepID=A0AAV4Y9W3_CAEEX|nr:hypothetical protein CEXT_499581 [Caerostris extrusa]
MNEDRDETSDASWDERVFQEDGVFSTSYPSMIYWSSRCLDPPPRGCDRVAGGHSKGVEVPHPVCCHEPLLGRKSTFNCANECSS